MKKIRAIALLLALCMLLAACTSGADTASIAEYEGGSVPAGVYLYQLTSAYGEAAAKEDDASVPLLEGTVEGVAAADWIRDRALKEVKENTGAELLFDRLGLSFDEDTAAAVKSNQDSMWEYYGTTMEKKGIARSSMDRFVSSVYKRDSVLKALFGEGGEKEIPDEKLRAAYEENYRRVEMLTISKTGVAEEDKETVAGLLDSYYERAAAGEDMTALMAEEYARQNGVTAEEAAEAVSMGQDMVIRRDNTGYPQELRDMIFSDGALDTPKKYSSDSYDVLFVVRELFSGEMSDFDYQMEHDTLLRDAAQDDLSASLAAAADEAGYRVNEKAVQRYKVADVVS